MSNYESYTGTEGQTNKPGSYQDYEAGSNINAGDPNPDTYNQAKQKAGEVVEQVQDKAGEVASTVKEQAASQISTQKEKAADGLGNVAQAIRQTGDQLRQNDQAGVAEYIEKAAQSIERFSSYLRERDLDEIVGGVERFARREPALFIGGAFTVGLLAARFLRSSSPDKNTAGSSYSSYNRQLPATYSGTRTGGVSSYSPGPVISSSTLKIDTIDDQSGNYSASTGQYYPTGTTGTSGLAGSSYGSTGTGSTGSSYDIDMPNTGEDTRL